MGDRRRWDMKPVSERAEWLKIRQPPREKRQDPEKLIYSVVKVMASQKQSDIERCIWEAHASHVPPSPATPQVSIYNIPTHIGSGGGDQSVSSELTLDTPSASPTA